MKTLSLSIVFNLIFSFGFSQPDPITIQFVEASPLWEQLVYDSTFYEIGIQPDINKYTVVVPYKSFRFSDDLLIYNYCINYNAEIYGYILEKMNIHTGEVAWQNYSTYYNNGQQDFYKNLYLRPDGKLEMDGIVRQGPYIDIQPFYWNVGGGSSNFSRKLFNYENGELLEHIVSQDSVVGIPPTNINVFPVQFDSTKLFFDLKLNHINNVYTFGFEIFELDKNQNFSDSTALVYIPFIDPDSTSATVFSFGQPQFIRKLNDSTYVCLLFKDKFYSEKIKTQLIWFNTSDLHNIHVTRRLNIEDYIPSHEESFLYFNFDVVGQDIYLSQTYNDDSLNTSTTFLTCFNQNGDLIRFFPRCIIDNQIYNSITLVYSNIAYDYFAVFPSRTGRSGMDILKLDKNTNTFQYISSLTSAVSDEQFYRQMEVCKLYDDDLFIIGAYTKKVGPVQNSAVKYYAFKGSDLGMEIETSTKPSPVKDALTLFPNPTSDYLNIKLPSDWEIEKNIQVKIVDQLGRVWKSQSIQGNEGTVIMDCESIAQGLYFLQLTSNERRIEREFVKL